ncbi:MAG: methyltransferase domain-containing protein [Burkholderiales bacterium]|nr:MAG: methyltransferase domain-containing protein [Burkholderiales bacterium]
MTDSSQIHWTQHDEPHTAHWHSERGLSAPQRVQLADDTLAADPAIKLAQSGVGLLWNGDFQNARHLVQALDRRLAKRNTRPPSAKQTLTNAFLAQRQSQAQRAKILGSVLIHLGADYAIALRRAPDVRLACTEAWGKATAGSRHVCSLRELLGIISAHEWRKKGVEVAALGKDRAGQAQSIHAHYGVFSPVRGEYLALIAKAALPKGSPADMIAWDVGTGTGVIAALLASRGIGSVVATDVSERALVCARENLKRLQQSSGRTGKAVEVLKANLFPEAAAHAKANLIVCNPPWLPAPVGSALEQAVYDEGSQMLLGFLKGVGERLASGGQAWLILSDLAERLGLRSREELMQAIEDAGLRVMERIDTQPQHPKAQDASDPLHAARSREITSLWRLAQK